MQFQSIKSQSTLNTNNKQSKAKQLQKAAANAIETVQKHFSKDPPKPVATRAQNGILKNIEKKEKIIKEQNQSSVSDKSRKSDVSEPSLYTTALDTE